MLNYFAGWRHVEKQANRKTLRHADVLELHRIFADGVMDQGTAVQYRSLDVQVGLRQALDRV